MTHQVLARKWRPRSFQEVVGQAPVVRALANSLDQNRLHHAYLLTGTRGVGKTSIARLLAKCLNCQQGVSSTPCGECQTCKAIDEGRFLDLLEVDAASRTKVEDTRDLLDNVQYAPTQGRYKVYLIDEVHMLSNHSFNALLKTLEEPPPHVKFLLATTDPQRLPVTVLSRCLQFHLKNLSQEQIAKQLAHILDAEKLKYEPAALKHLAHAAQGSMRDALSLMDQAIAYTNGELTSKEVKALLGATEPELLISLLNRLVEGNAKSMLEEIHALAETGIDFLHALEELLSLLHQTTLEQTIPGVSQESHNDAEEIVALAKKLTAETLQLYYQIALIGRRDLPLAPTPRSGFEMVLLRMLAFSPQRISIESFLTPHKVEQAVSSPTPAMQKKPLPVQNNPTAALKNTMAEVPRLAPSVQLQPATAVTASRPRSNCGWDELLASLNLQGAAAIVASHCTLIQQTADFIQLALDPHHTALLNKNTETQIANALKQYFEKPMELVIRVGQENPETPALLDKKHQEQRQYQATDALAADTNLQALMDQFGGKIIANSVKAKK